MSNESGKVIIDDNDPTTYVISKLDGKKYTRILWSHVRRCSDTMWNVDDYCREFNITKSETVCEKLRAKLSWTLKSCTEMYGEELGKKIK